MEKNNINKIRKIIAIIILILFIIGFVKLLPTFMNLTNETGRMEFKNDVSNFGLKGRLSIIALEVFKILLIFLPGEPIELLAGMCYGAIGGLLLIYVGVILSNFLIIFLVKKFGSKIVNDTVPEEKKNKVIDLINEHPSGAETTLVILYFLPILPKDFITYIASLLPISTKKILVISIIGRFPSVFSSVLCGSRLIKGDIKSVIIVYAITYIFSGLVAYSYKKRTKLKDEERNV